jgi:hypothetical protein
MASPVIIAAAAMIFARYARYFANVSLDIGKMLMLKVLFLVSTAIFVFAMHHGFAYFRNGINWSSDDRFRVQISCIGYFMALLLGMLGYVFPYVDRICLYFYLYEGVYFGSLFKGKKRVNRFAFGCVITFIIGYSFLYSITNNSQGTIPYLFYQ